MVNVDFSHARFGAAAEKNEATAAASRGDDAGGSREVVRRSDCVSRAADAGADPGGRRRATSW